MKTYPQFGDESLWRVRSREYPEGTRVRLVSWADSEIIDDNKIVPPGTCGTVAPSFADTAGTVWVQWDNGIRLGVTTGDRIAKIEVKHEVS